MVAFSISPSDLPWWGWFLCAIITGLLCLLNCWEIVNAGIEERRDWIYHVLAVVTGIAAVVCFLLGIFRFAAWIWNG